MARIVSLMAAAVATAAAFLFMTPAGCADLGGVPVGRHAPRFSALQPSPWNLGLDVTLENLPSLVIEVLVGLLAWCSGPGT